MAGGLGTRMRSAVPKHFHPLLGRPMFEWIVEAGRDVEYREVGQGRIVLVIPPANDRAYALTGPRDTSTSWNTQWDRTWRSVIES